MSKILPDGLTCPEENPLRRAVGRADRKVAHQYYLSFWRSKDPGVLLEFMDKHPVQFESSSWVLSAFGYLLLGFPFQSAHVREKQAKKLFHDYWCRVKHGPDAREAWRGAVDVMMRHAGADKFSTREHRPHFADVTRWIANHTAKKDNFALFKKTYPNSCPCITAENFPDIQKAVQKARWHDDADKLPIAHVLKELKGVVCGISEKTIRNYT